MKIIIYCSLILLGYNVSFAQDCTIRLQGIVKDKHDSRPIRSAKIYIKGTNIQTETDSLGSFVLKNLCPGEIQVVCFHHVGCEPERKDIQLSENLYLDFAIEYHLLELEEANVVHFVLDNSPISVVKMSQLDKIYMAGKTLGEQLTQIPGVQTLSTGASISKPVIHGLHSNRIVLMNNGIRQEGQQWGSEHAPEIDPFLSTEMSVVKGASAVKYGPEALGGVLLMDPSPWSAKKGWNADFLTGFYSNGRQGFGSIKIENNSKKVNGLSFRVHGTLKKSGNISAPNYVMGNTGFGEYNFSVASRYAHEKNSFEIFYSQFNTQLGIFTGSHIGNLSDLKAAFLAKEPLLKSEFTYTIVPPSQTISHELLKVDYQRIWNQRQRSSIAYSRQINDRAEYDADQKTSSENGELVPDFRLRLTTSAIDFIQKSKWNDRFETQIGTQLTYQKNARAGRFLVPNFYKLMGGIFAIGNVHREHWDFEGGARWDFVGLKSFYYENDSLISPVKNFENASATVGAARSFGHHWLLKLNLGTAWRPPSISELYSNGLHHGAASIEVGNSNLKKEQSNSAQIGGQYKSNKLSANLDMYYMYFGNYIYLRPNGIELSIKGAFPSFVYESVKAQYLGLDFSLEYHFSKGISYIGKYNLVRAENLRDHSYLIGIPPDRLRNGLAFVFAFKKARKLNLSATTDYVFKQTRFTENADYIDPPSDYLLLNMAINYDFFLKEKSLRLALTVDNLFNKSYRDYMNRFRYFTDERGINFGLKIDYKF